MKDAMLDASNNSYMDVQQFMITLYYLFKKSPRVSWHFKSTAEIMDVQVLKFPKVHGTRLIAHQRRGLEALLKAWMVLDQLAEKLIASKKGYPTIAGILKKLQSFDFLLTCCFM